MALIAEIVALACSLVELARLITETLSAHRASRYVPKHMGKRRGGSAQHKKDR